MSDAPKKYIITTGDVTDFDGFLTLPLYKMAAAKHNCDVIFIMNYPAYMNDLQAGGKGKKKRSKGGSIDDIRTLSTNLKHELSKNIDLLKIQSERNNQLFNEIVSKLLTGNTLIQLEKDRLATFKKSKSGLGYEYNSDEFFKIQPLEGAAIKYEEHYKSNSAVTNKKRSYENARLRHVYDSMG